MVIFHSYVSLPEGMSNLFLDTSYLTSSPALQILRPGDTGNRIWVRRTGAVSFFAKDVGAEIGNFLKKIGSLLMKKLWFTDEKKWRRGVAHEKSEKYDQNLAELTCETGDFTHQKWGCDKMWLAKMKATKCVTGAIHDAIYIYTYIYTHHLGNRVWSHKNGEYAVYNPS